MTTITDIQAPVSAELLRAVQVGTTTAEAAIAAVEQFGADEGTLLLRLGVLQVLKLQLNELRPANEDEAQLLAAYHRWVHVGLDYMGPAPQATGRDYALASGALTLEMQLAAGVQMPVGGRGATPFAPTGEGS